METSIEDIVGFTREELANMPTIYTGQCCSCKISDQSTRIWLCRVGGGITLERYRLRGGWVAVAGGCDA